MVTHKVAVIAGDGIGPEVLAEGKKVLEKVAELDGTFQFDFTDFPWGCEYYLKNGRMMAEDGIEQLSKFDANLPWRSWLSGRAGSYFSLGSAADHPQEIRPVM